jgi:hypothetical protein
LLFLLLQGSVSPTFYEQLFCVKIPKVQKDTGDFTVFLHASGI